MIKRILILLAYVAAVALAAAGGVKVYGVSGKTATARANPPATPAAVKATFFPIGVWYQPLSSFGKWGGRRVNTLWGYEGEGGTVTADAWCAGAVAGRFNYVLQDTAATRAHWNDLNCIAISYPDEANATGPGDVPIPPEQLQARRAADRQWTAKPILLNFDGWKLQWQSDDLVKAYCDTADWLALDYYVVNRGEGISAWPRVQAQIDRLKRLAPGKPIIVFIECSDQNLRIQDWLHTPANQPQGEQQAALMRGPTAQEQTYELDQAFAAGCGVVYFPDRIGKNWEAFDATPDANAAGMSTWNAAHTTASPAPTRRPRRLRKPFPTS